MDPQSLFPRSGKTTHLLLGEWLRDLVLRTEQRAAAVEPMRFKEICALLIESEQLEVIGEELPNVIVDAVHEQSKWGSIQVRVRPHTRSRGATTNGPPASAVAPAPDPAVPAIGANAQDADAVSPPPWIWADVRSFLDPFLTVWVGNVVANASVALHPNDPNATSPSRTQLGRFFTSSYRVGTEQVTTGIPNLVLLEILGRALLVTLNCVLGFFGEKAVSIRRNPLFIFGLSLPLRAFYGTIWLLRRAPSLGTFVLSVYVIGGLAILTVIAYLLGMFSWIPPVGWGVFFVTIVGLLVVLTWLLIWRNSQMRGGS
jgi:hypothetical protein